MTGDIVLIPFAPDMEDAVLDGILLEDGRRVFKDWTSRRKVYGRSGDLFHLRHHTYEIVEVFKATLAEVAEHHEREGFRSKEAFIARWRELHPRRGYDPEERVWVHVFRPNENVIIELSGDLNP